MRLLCFVPCLPLVSFMACLILGWFRNDMEPVCLDNVVALFVPSFTVSFGLGLLVLWLPWLCSVGVKIVPRSKLSWGRMSSLGSTYLKESLAERSWLG